jgi:hypothetical protein
LQRNQGEFAGFSGVKALFFKDLRGFSTLMAE